MSSPEEKVLEELEALRKENKELKKKNASQLELNHKLWEDNAELARKCKEHYENCRKMIRFELQQPEAKGAYLKTNDGRIIELDK